MSKFPVADATVQRWLLTGPLAAYVPTIVDRLRQGRYSESTIKPKFRPLMGEFSFVHQPLGMKLGVRALSTAGSARSTRGRALAWRLGW
jgi:hypothetical protein